MYLINKHKIKSVKSLKRNNDFNITNNLRYCFYEQKKLNKYQTIS